MKRHMSTAIHIKTRVLTGGRIEITAPELQEGQEADVIITVQSHHLPDEASRDAKVHVLDIVATLPPRRNFQTAEEVERYIREERDSWDQ
jgi:hypothetical protein